MNSTRTKHPYCFFAALLLVMSLALSMSAQTPSFTPAPEGVFETRTATVDSAIKGAANLTNTADDYTVPQGTYFNGVPLEVIAVEETLGDFPVELDDPQGLWARVVIGKTDGFDGIIGFMPLVSLNFDETAETGSLPQAELAGESDSALYRSNGLTDQELGRYPQGTPVTILGWLKGWAHVLVSGQIGFVKPEQLKMDDAARAAVTAALPESFDDIQPGYQQKYDEYVDQVMLLYDKYGDSNVWPLEIKAQASALASQYGFEFEDVVNVMPESDDLPKTEVYQLAIKAALELYGMDESAWADYSLSFSHPAGEPENRGWKVNLWANPGMPDSVVWLDRAGNVTNAQLNDFSLSPEWDDDYAPQTLEDMMSSIDYFLYGVPYEPAAGDMSKEQAQDAAWTVFSEEIEEKERAQYQITADAYRNDGDTLRWWLVSLGDPVLPDYAILYHVALILPDGAQRVASDTGMYLDEQAWAAEYLTFLELEKERGPLYTWSLDQKAEWDPEYFGLPQEGDISRETAEKTAKEKVMSEFGMTQADLDELETAVFFEIYGERVWTVLLFPKAQGLADEGGTSYSVRIDAATGDVLDVAGPGIGG